MEELAPEKPLHSLSVARGAHGFLAGKLQENILGLPWPGPAHSQDAPQAPGEHRWTQKVLEG